MNKEDLISRMTLEEKIDFIHGAAFFKNKGIKRLGIMPLVMSDGPMGVRHELRDNIWEDKLETEDYVTYFPSNMALASTWNPDLAACMGDALGAEARGRGKDVILAPGINIVRSPLCGRNFEYMSEDPCLTAKMAVPFIQGVQRNDVSACVKHFAANNQETNRMEVDARVDERTLREIYLPAFEACVKDGGVYSVMSAYNRLNGEYCSHSRWLLDDVLRKEWGFEGLVVSDWGAVHDTKKAASCGLDLEMSTDPQFEKYCMANPLLEMVKSGEIPEEWINRKVGHILGVMEKIRSGDSDRKPGSYNTASNQESALKVAREAIILLKNERTLPLDTRAIHRLGVIGENAQRRHAPGGGSAEIKALYEISPILGISMACGGNTEIVYEKGYSSEDGADAEELTRRALELAHSSDQLVFIGGQNHDLDSEGMDRQSMKLPYHQKVLILKLLDVRPDMVIVILTGSPVELEEIAERAKALILMPYAGCEGGKALGEILTGQVNPSGKLSVTYPRKPEDCPACVEDPQVEYQEKAFVGYRYFDRYQKMPLFSFGHGLSYTQFSYRDMVLVQKGDGVECRARIKNCGCRAGMETVQLYVKLRQKGVIFPEKELKGFQKLFLPPGGEQEIRILLEERDFSYYEQKEKGWIRAAGKISVCLGASSRDIRLEQELQWVDAAG